MPTDVGLMSSIWCENLREVKNYGARYWKFQENDYENHFRIDALHGESMLCFLPGWTCCTGHFLHTFPLT